MGGQQLQVAKSNKNIFFLIFELVAPDEKLGRRRVHCPPRLLFSTCNIDAQQKSNYDESDMDAILLSRPVALSR